MRSPILRLFGFQRREAAWVIDRRWETEQRDWPFLNSSGECRGGRPKLRTSHFKGSTQAAHSWGWPGVSPLLHRGETSPKRGWELGTRVPIRAVGVQNPPGEFLVTQKCRLCQRLSVLLQISSEHTHPRPCSRKENEGDRKGQRWLGIRPLEA